MYAIRRVEDGKYVAKDGMKSSYTFDIRAVRTFHTLEDAERELCVGNEYVVNL